MSVARHLGIRVGEYDRRIRTFIPRYDELLDEAAGTLALLRNRRPHVVDLGIGSGALAARCLRRAPRATITGIDADEEILGLARRRLGRAGRRVTLVTGRFDRTPIPRCDAIVATLALHHLRTAAAKRRYYARCFAALRRGGLLATGDLMPAADPVLARAQYGEMTRHLRRHYSARRTAGFFDAWAGEDTYFTLEDELAMLRAAGFAAGVAWRKGLFAVLVGRKR